MFLTFQKIDSQKDGIKRKPTDKYSKMKKAIAKRTKMKKMSKPKVCEMFNKFIISFLNVIFSGIHTRHNKGIVVR